MWKSNTAENANASNRKTKKNNHIVLMTAKFYVFYRFLFSIWSVWTRVFRVAFFHFNFIHTHSKTKRIRRRSRENRRKTKNVFPITKSQSITLVILTVADVLYYTNVCIILQYRTQFKHRLTLWKPSILPSDRHAAIPLILHNHIYSLNYYLNFCWNCSIFSLPLRLLVILLVPAIYICIFHNIEIECCHFSFDFEMRKRCVSVFIVGLDGPVSLFLYVSAFCVMPLVVRLFLSLFFIISFLSSLFRKSPFILQLLSASSCIICLVRLFSFSLFSFSVSM